jgi:hypothetical protein
LTTSSSPTTISTDRLIINDFGGGGDAVVIPHHQNQFLLELNDIVEISAYIAMVCWIRSVLSLVPPHLLCTITIFMIEHSN